MTAMRIGHGVDAHRLVAGRPLVLGGIEIPHDRGLDGHSDGDAVTHALADAVLGAAGQGDLGRHFPSGDERWRGVSSLLLLEEAAALARQHGWAVESAQVVAICEAPRLGHHVAAMQEALARALGVEPERVAVSPTTTDGMGFTGRGEGIAATAVVLLAPIS
ncbi:MAG TPA: 2-C-methyl-D-erythritol 2,4-cyclodiphosphate synthase [Candidatus Dormibacteraeota bacterium]|jgi:2-C-methyl-D-erythritol 2,4-cyclodiphosphate synthase|nr:2-C-methyl-D-erythritol 2,4-cyclodiphosphate synthase [Candidatus Dormibacteraeota bacterium]